MHIAQSCPVAGGVASCTQFARSVELQKYNNRRLTLIVVMASFAPGSKTIPARPSSFDVRTISSSNLAASFWITRMVNGQASRSCGYREAFNSPPRSLHLLSHSSVSNCQRFGLHVLL